MAFVASWGVCHVGLASAGADGLWSAQWTNCPTSYKTFFQYLAKGEEKLADHWEKTAGQAIKANPSSDDNAKIFRLITPYLLPDGLPFSDFDRNCYPHFRDFKTNLGRGQIKTAQNYFSSWKGCVTFNYRTIPVPIAKFVSCFDSLGD